MHLYARTLRTVSLILALFVYWAMDPALSQAVGLVEIMSPSLNRRRLLSISTNGANLKLCINVMCRRLHFQAHFKAVTKVEFTACGGYCVTVSEDGMARVWEVAQIVDQSEIVGRAGASVSVSSRRSIIPYR